MQANIFHISHTELKAICEVESYLYGREIHAFMQPRSSLPYSRKPTI